MTAVCCLSRSAGTVVTCAQAVRVDVGRVRLHRAALGARRPAQLRSGNQAPPAAGTEIRRRGCDRVALSTYSFQAPGFYGRFGFTEGGRTPGYPHGHEDIDLVKLFR